MTWPCKLVASGAVLIGTFLMLGGYGHLAVIIPQVVDQPTDGRIIALVASGGILLLPGLLNLIIAWWLAKAQTWAFMVSFIGTLTSFIYLFYLLVVGVQDHPMAPFVGAIGIYLVLLVFVWIQLGKTNRAPGPE